ncbi:hypothetical protein V1264_011460 [Littorina saxatilis]
MADNAELEEKDVPMEDVTEVDEDELLGTKTKNGEDLDESMKDIKLEGDSGQTGAAVPLPEVQEEKKEEEPEKKEEDEDDGGAASDIEFSMEDDRSGAADDTSWTWHIEMYPLSPEDAQLENFVKMLNVATQGHIVIRTNEQGEKKGEVHFYTEDAHAAKTLMRTICCRKFTHFRPHIYLYRKKEGEGEEYESASLRLDLIEAAKMRWDRQRKNKGEPASRIATVSEVPVSTSKEFLNVLFARAYHIKRESDESEAEEAKKAKEADENDESKAESSATAEKKEEKDDDEDKDENNEEEEELVGEFNGKLTIDCCSRTSLKGFLLGYRKVVIGNNLLSIKPLSSEEFDVDALRKEVRAKRRYEAIHGKEWVPVTQAERGYRNDDASAEGKSYNNKEGRGGGRGRGGRGGRGAVAGGRGGGGARGGVMTGRQKMNEKSMRRGFGRDSRDGRDVGPRGGRGASRGGGGGGYREEMRYLQSQLQMNTFELQRQIASLRGRDRSFGGGYRDYPPDPYDLPPVGRP